MATFEMAPMDAPMRASTWTILALLAASCVLLLSFAARPDSRWVPRAVLVVLALGMVASVFGAYAFAPRALEVQPGTLLIHRKVGPIRIAATTARSIPPEQLRG